MSQCFIFDLFLEEKVVLDKDLLSRGFTCSQLKSVTRLSALLMDPLLEKPAGSNDHIKAGLGEVITNIKTNNHPIIMILFNISASSGGMSLNAFT